MISYDKIYTRDITIYSIISGDIIIYSSSNVKCKYHESLNLGNQDTYIYTGFLLGHGKTHVCIFFVFGLVQLGIYFPWFTDEYLETVYVSRRPGVYVATCPLSQLDVAIRFVASILTLAQSSKHRSIEVTSPPFVSLASSCVLHGRKSRLTRSVTLPSAARPLH
jgi:hypothetical protein